MTISHVFWTEMFEIIVEYYNSMHFGYLICVNEHFDILNFLTENPIFLLTQQYIFCLQSFK